MHCICCDTELTDLETSRKSKVTGQYLDTCDDCFSTVSDVFIDLEEQLEEQQLEETQLCQTSK